MGRFLFVTGAASGIGRATAGLFRRRGWEVALFDRDREGLSRAAEALRPVLARPLDVADQASWQRAVSAFAEVSGGQLDVLFNCAGVAAGGWFEDVPVEVARRILEVNLLGTIHGIYACLPLLRRTPGARIVNMSSMSACYGTPMMAVYSATKFAVRGLTEALDLELERCSVGVCDIMPGYVDTPLLDSPDYSDSGIELRSQRVCPPEQVAEVVWEAAHGGPVHRTVGLEATRLRWVAGLFPGLARWISRRKLRRLLDEARCSRSR